MLREGEKEGETLQAETQLDANTETCHFICPLILVSLCYKKLEPPNEDRGWKLKHQETKGHCKDSQQS